MSKRSTAQAIYLRPTSTRVNGRWVHGTRPETVHVILRAEGYAMVRLPGAMPIIVSEKDLSDAPGKQAVA